MIARNGRTIALAMGLLALSSMVSTVRAQGNSFNPYGNSGYADYREYGNPIYSGNTTLPGQGRLSGEALISRPRANSYQQYTDELEGRDSPTRRPSGAGLPYYQAYQQLNRQYDRVYRPNDTKADRDFEERLKRRNENYAKALVEKDPVKRAKLLRQVAQDSLDRPASSARTQASATTGTPKAATRSSTAPAPRRRAPSPYDSPNERRSPAPAPAPSPYPAPRRSTAPAPTTAAPAPARSSAPGTAPTSRPAPDPSTIVSPR